MIKRSFAVIAALLAVSSLAGCKNTSTGSSDAAVTSDIPASSDSVSSDSANASEDAAPPAIAEDGYPATRAGDYVRAALYYGNWSGMEAIPEDAFEFVIPDFDRAWAEEYCFAHTMISVNLFKIYVIKPADGCRDKVRQWLNDYLDYCRESAAFYPQQQEQAAGAVIGETVDGYCYLICHEKGADIADRMEAAM